MKTKNIFPAIFFFLFAIILIAGCGKTEDKSGRTEKIVGDSTLVRDKNIDVASLDKNGDGYVYQCHMHSNVISDDSTQCSICMMDLEKYTVSQAQNNLKENKSNMH